MIGFFVCTSTDVATFLSPNTRTALVLSSKFTELRIVSGLRTEDLLSAPPSWTFIKYCYGRPCHPLPKSSECQNCLTELCSYFKKTLRRDARVRLQVPSSRSTLADRFCISFALPLCTRISSAMNSMTPFVLDSARCTCIIKGDFKRRQLGQ